MKVSYQWLRDYIDLPQTPDELADVFTDIGLEVDGIVHHGALLKDIRTAKIESITQHPDADRLVITSVFDGTTHHQIVTGANNISVGDVVPLSVPGSVVANGMVLRAAKLRGVESFGMLCSEVELGVAVESKGIWILPASTPLGVDFIAYAQLKDTVFDLAILPNRSDCLSLYGIARELSAKLKLPLKAIPFDFKPSLEKNPYLVSVETPTCMYYSLHVIKNLNTLETPMILQRRLELSGIRPISLPVDITNYVMLELGQPLHVFDETALKAQTITVRHAREGEAFVSLDGQTRDLLASDCVISDGNTTLAIGGVMGGANSGVNETTHSVVLEAALFDPIATRRTANRLALRTESAIRFEKNVNPEGVLAAAQRAAYLFQTIAGGTVEGLPVVYKNNTSTVFTETQLPFHIEAINAILGTTYSESDAVALLERLGFKRVSDQVIVPSWRRHACTTGASLAEEIARIGGFDSIPSSLPVQHSIQDSRSDFDRLKQESETWLIQNGLLQAVTFPMISPEDIKTCLLNSNSLITITNPITADQSVMRPSLLPSLLKIASFNAARQAESLRYMDAGRTFQEINGMIKETECLAGLVSGARLEHTYCEPEKKSELFTFYSAKALLEGVLSIWNVQPEFRATYLPDYFHPKQGASLRFKETTIGYIGTVHPHITKAYGLPENTFYFEIYLSKLLQFPIQPKRFDSISKFPSTRRDIAFSTPKSLTYAAISAVISKYKPTLVRNWYMFDLFESEAIGADKKSIAFAFIYQNINETISDEAVNDAHRVFYQQLQDTLPITIR